MITRLLHTRYRVHDLEKTVSFYRDVLGLEETRRSEKWKGIKVGLFQGTGEMSREICQYDASGPVQVGPDLTHLAFEVTDELAKEAALEGLPATVLIGVLKGLVIAFIDAPEGYESSHPACPAKLIFIHFFSSIFTVKRSLFFHDTSTKSSEGCCRTLYCSFL